MYFMKDFKMEVLLLFVTEKKLLNEEFIVCYFVRERYPLIKIVLFFCQFCTYDSCKRTPVCDTRRVFMEVTRLSYKTISKTSKKQQNSFASKYIAWYQICYLLIRVSATPNDIIINDQSPKSALSFKINTIQTNFYLLIDLADFCWLIPRHTEKIVVW